MKDILSQVLKELAPFRMVIAHETTVVERVAEPCDILSSISYSNLQGYQIKAAFEVPRRRTLRSVRRLGTSKAFLKRLPSRLEMKLTTTPCRVSPRPFPQF